MIDQSNENPTYQTVAEINGHKFADLWLAGRASPKGDQRFQWMALRLGGSITPLWFDTEETAREYVDSLKYSFGPIYISKTIAVSDTKTSREWSVFE